MLRTAATASATFCVVLTGLGLQMRSGEDPVLGAGEPAPEPRRPVVVRRVVVRRVIEEAPAAAGPAAAPAAAAASPPAEAPPPAAALAPVVSRAS